VKYLAVTDPCHEVSMPGLLGRDTYVIGRDDAKGWFRWDTLESR
jgi:hypothetical protein